MRTFAGIGIVAGLEVAALVLVVAARHRARERGGSGPGWSGGRIARSIAGSIAGWFGGPRSAGHGMLTAVLEVEDAAAPLPLGAPTLPRRVLTELAADPMLGLAEVRVLRQVQPTGAGLPERSQAGASYQGWNESVAVALATAPGVGGDAGAEPVPAVRLTWIELRLAVPGSRNGAAVARAAGPIAARGGGRLGAARTLDKAARSAAARLTAAGFTAVRLREAEARVGLAVVDGETVGADADGAASWRAADRDAGGWEARFGLTAGGGPARGRMSADGGGWRTAAAGRIGRERAGYRGGRPGWNEWTEAGISGRDVGTVGSGWSGRRHTLGFDRDAFRDPGGEGQSGDALGQPAPHPLGSERSLVGDGTGDRVLRSPGDRLAQPAHRLPEPGSVFRSPDRGVEPAPGSPGPLTLSPSGLLIGLDPAHRALILTLFRRSPLHLALVAGLPLAQILALRAAALGAHVVVETARDTDWDPLLLHSGLDAPRLTVQPVGHAFPAAAPTPAAPRLILRDCGARPPYATIPATPWTSVLTVLPFLDPRVAGHLAAADLVGLQRVTAEEAAVVRQVTGLAERDADALPDLPEHMVLWRVRGRAARYCEVSPTMWESGLVGPLTATAGAR